MWSNDSPKVNLKGGGVQSEESTIIRKHNQEETKYKHYQKKI